MSFLQKIDDDYKTALKTSESLKVSVLRMLKSALKNRQIDKGRELSDDDILSVISTLCKQRKESIELFSKGGRTDLAEKESKELAILQLYLPRQLSLEELDNIILDSIKESSAQGLKDLGKVMRIVISKVKGAADGHIVNQRVKDILSGT